MDGGNCSLLNWIEEREARHAGERAYFARSELALESPDRPSKVARLEALVSGCPAQERATSVEAISPNARVRWTRHMGWLVRLVL